MDVVQQIRERLDGWAPPGAWVDAFADAAAPTPDELAAFAEDLSAAIAEGKFAGPVVVLPPSPRFYPGFEQMRAALLAVLELAQASAKYGPIMVPDSSEGRARLIQAAAWQEALEGAVNVVADKLGVEIDG